MKILIADDHAIVREGLKQILTDLDEPVQIDEAADGHEAIEKVCENEYDVVILDIAMPEVNGLDALKQIKKFRPDLPVVILSMYPEEQYAIRMFKAGAAGYLTKESAPDELLRAIRKVKEGKKYISESLAERLVEELDLDLDRGPHEMLSDREFQVLCMLASGKSITEIADELSLSVKTISTYRTRIMEKLGLKNSAELIHYAVKYRLMSL